MSGASATLTKTTLSKLWTSKPIVLFSFFISVKYLLSTRKKWWKSDEMRWARNKWVKLTIKYMLDCNGMEWVYTMKKCEEKNDEQHNGM